MVTSIDGATVVEGRSGGLSSPADSELLLSLRSLADVVLVGAGTVRAEGYGAPRKAGLRVGVVTSSGAGLDFESPLFASGAGFVVTTQDAPQLPVDTVRAGHSTLDIRLALQRLDGDVVHVEGGPTLNGALLAADVVDEVNLTFSPHLVGGTSARLTATPVVQLERFRLAHVLEDDDFLFCRDLHRDRLTAPR